MPETAARERDYVGCPAPACNRKDRRSVIREHLAEMDDQRHERFDGTEI
jgi:tRNA(Ile)-lysidine synthase TilS/MesJ